MSAKRTKVTGLLPFVAAAMLVVAGCGGSSSGPETVGVPDPDLSNMEPRVRELLSQGRERLLAAEDSAEAWGEMGTLYDAHGLMDVAETCYSRAHELAPDDFRWIYLLAVVREINGAEVDELQQLFGRAAELRPGYSQIYLRLGDALQRRGLHEPSQEQFERAIELAPDTAAAHRGLGQAFLSLGDAAAAVTSLERAAELESADRATYAALAQAHMRLGEAELAQQAAAKSEGLEPINAIDDPVYGELVFDRSVSSSRVFRRGMSRLRGGDHLGAVKDFEMVLEARPDDASVRYWLGTAYKSRQQVDEAIENFARAVELNERMIKARTELAGLLFSQQRYPEAAEHYRLALELTPEDPKLHLALAEVLMRQGDVQGLVVAYTNAERHRELDAREHANFGVALMRTERPAQAIEHFGASLDRRPDNPNVLYNMGLAYEMLGDVTRGHEMFARAAELNPDSAAARHLSETHEEP